MVDEALAREFPWLKHDAAAILGDARPQTTKALLEKSDLWSDLFRDWLIGQHRDSLIEGFSSLHDRKTLEAGKLPQLERAYQEFYGAAGRMKDMARKDAAGVRTRYPWAPANVADLLGQARPKTFADLLDEGPTGAWYGSFQAWLVQYAPFDGAAEWLVWAARTSDTAGWLAALDPSVREFADEIGRLKDALREKHGNKVERAAEKAREESKGIWDRIGEKFDEINTPRERAGEPRGQRKVEPRSDEPKAPQTKQPPAVPPRRDLEAAKFELHNQVMLANEILTAGPTVRSHITHLTTRFAAFGGTLAEESASLAGYGSLVADDLTGLGQQLQAAVDGWEKAGKDTTFALLAGVRAAVYRVAWNLDIAYQTYYGGWPHQRIWYVLDALNNLESPHVRYAGGRAMQSLMADVQAFYASAIALLDKARELVATKAPGYTVEDGAQPWGAHELMQAKAQLDSFLPMAAALVAEEPTEDEEQDVLNEAAAKAFGVSYASLVQLV